jgi:hypothetical protein
MTSEPTFSRRPQRRTGIALCPAISIQTLLIHEDLIPAYTYAVLILHSGEESSAMVQWHPAVLDKTISEEYETKSPHRSWIYKHTRAKAVDTNGGSPLSIRELPMLGVADFADPKASLVRRPSTIKPVAWPSRSMSLIIHLTLSTWCV